MRSTQAIGRPPADAHHRMPAGAGPRGGGQPAVPPDTFAVDADVPGAVVRELRALLAERLAAGHALEPVFAEDIAERVARFTLAGGRRIRPRLLWWSLRACGGGETAQARAALRVMAALELIQTCALVHDDLMDRAATRRGAPALHADVAEQYTGTASPPRARWLGASAATLAGDLALAWADDVLTEVLLDSGLPGGTAHRLQRAWRTLRTEMVAGQYLDVQGQAAGVRTLARSIRAACLKSARYTVQRPLELGAVLAGADPSTTEALGRAGRDAGLAFQLRDDLDDLFADPRSTGKPSGGDVREGKPAYPPAAARALATAAGDRHALDVLDRAEGRADLTERELAEVRRVLVDTGARDLVETRINRLTAQSLRRLDATALEPRAAARLRALLTEVTGAPGHPPEPGGPRGQRSGSAGSSGCRSESGGSAGGRSESGGSAGGRSESVGSYGPGSESVGPSGPRFESVGSPGQRLEQAGPSGSRSESVGPSGCRSESAGPSGSLPESVGPSGHRSESAGPSGPLPELVGPSGHLPEPAGPPGYPSEQAAPSGHRPEPVGSPEHRPEPVGPPRHPAAADGPTPVTPLPADGAEAGR
ncbi:polyprenyl synthetase family protein [Streptomyces pyxinicus]|uniref:polyprenyl synthetase family protein n=1 Tax=Streptomyces pyxinicus TaxID=2970331 RepID=UPI00286833EA|nr:polyprenyl synthetase family protein [Streptomyces sp. LP11]